MRILLYIATVVVICGCILSALVNSSDVVKSGYDFDDAKGLHITQYVDRLELQAITCTDDRLKFDRRITLRKVSTVKFTLSHAQFMQMLQDAADNNRTKHKLLLDAWNSRKLSTQS